jgi:hypothetical protein
MPNPMDSLIALILKNSRNGIMVFEKLFVQDFPTDPEGFFLVEQNLNVLQNPDFSATPDRHLTCVHMLLPVGAAHRHRKTPEDYISFQ